MEIYEEPMAEIKKTFKPLVGKKLQRYETAEMFFEEDKEWDKWDDMPIHLYFEGNMSASISWYKFDDLFLSDNKSLRFEYGNRYTKVRWIENRWSRLDNICGQLLRNVELGRGKMSMEGRDIEIWTRLLLTFDSSYFEIYNAMDENGFDFHEKHPDGEFLKCL